MGTRQVRSTAARSTPSRTGPRVCDSSGARLAMMKHYYQRLFGGLLGLFLVGPAVTILIARLLQLQPPGGVELFLGGVVGAVVGALTASRIANRSEERSGGV